ncbi:hypothetical protein BST81_03655 [Leptolyngbya sp. 'hensonii']|uniref:peptidoglycan DD-metalloendopeptidase family protein n=1 Tax=Leptolyngbya sp. 'hensonii' TaxID=1922337 RepID=UPI000950010E|nr:peptidoglycan DD-metalloendopeptidase family protein [Leptolyngbya sp. 'hensonii']OLP19648.1 hypothetical protein BST81_03655 [Leptolyngbya sp. 'hensonii']
MPHALSTPGTQPLKSQFRLYGLGVGLLSFCLVGGYPILARTQTVASNSDLNQVMTQVESNRSWSEASFPVENFRGYSSYYGDSRLVNGISDFNRGIDIVTQEGSYVRSWLGGRVERLAVDPVCGVTIVIQSGPWRHSYCNLRGTIQPDATGVPALVDSTGQVMLRVGQVVQVGSRIGRVGVISQMGQALLHWEIQYGDRWIDPADILTMMYAQQQTQVAAIQPLRQDAAPASRIVIALRRAIIGQESAGNFRAVNPHSGALGYGQVMPFNVRAWSIEALGYPLTPQQFINSPQLQLQIIDYKLGQYWQSSLRLSGGDEEIAVRMVAAQWYSGDPRLYNGTRVQRYNGGRYPSIQAYTLAVLSRYKTFRNN